MKKMKTKQLHKIEWREIPLFDLVECLDGKRVPLNSRERSEIKGDIPYYGANGQVDSINKYIFNEELLLVAEDGGSWGNGENCAYIINGKSWINNHAHVLRVNKRMANISFLKYFLNYSNLNRHIIGTTRGKLNQTKMKLISVVIPFQDEKPDLAQQNRIVSILEDTESSIQRGKNTEKLLDEYLKSVFYEMFGDPITNNKKWPRKRFDEIVKLRRGFDLPSQKRKEGKYKVMASNGFHSYHNEYKINGPGIVTGRSGTIGEVHFIKDNYWPLNTTLYSEEMFGNNPTFLLYFVKFFKLKRFLRGTGTPTLNRNLVHVKYTGLPPVKLQNKFEEIVKHIGNLKENIMRVNKNSNELFNSLLYKAFKGELAT